jgi:hypothetical protein
MKISDKLFLAGVICLMGWLMVIAIRGDYESELGKRITQGINCVKYGKDCPGN